MKVKRLPSDFIVREQAHLPVDAGPHAVYRLDKCGLGTPEAVSEILSHWNLPRNTLAYGGLKDRHATTSQYLTIFRGPRESLEQAGFSLAYLGQSPRSMSAAEIICNRFQITLRSLTAEQAGRLQRLAQADASGATRLAIPNYFDDQRFGSLGSSGEFIALPWCLANYERALYLALAEENPHDRPNDRLQKEILRDHWGDWQACKERLDRSHRRSIVTYLVDHPQGFKKAVALIRRDLRSIYVAAFQAKLWNEVAVRYLQQTLPATRFLTMYAVGGPLLFPVQVEPDTIQKLSRLQIPLPSGRKTAWPPGVERLLDAALEPFGLPRHKLRFAYPRDVFFARGLRNLILAPANLSCALSQDELGDDQQQKLQVEFDLLPGQYATMFLKALEMLAGDENDQADLPNAANELP